MKKEQLKSALESMVWQFGYRTTINDHLAIVNGGLSALEEAFAALGWGNPHWVDDPTMECDVEGCHQWRAPQIIWDGFYSCICDRHFAEYCLKKLRPPMKQSAIDREASRDKNGHLPNPEVRKE
jgi:hypothetical protein